MATTIIRALQEEKAVTSFGRLMELMSNDFSNSQELKKYNSDQLDWAFENVLTMLEIDYGLIRIVGQRAMANRSFELTAKGYDLQLSPDFNGYLAKKRIYHVFDKSVPWAASALALFLSFKSLIENNQNWPTYIYMLLALLFGIIIGHEIKQRN